MDRRLFVIGAATLPLYAGPATIFSAEEAEIVSALTNCIIPADDAPGALAAGVVFYIDKQLAGPLKRYRAAYHSGILRFATDCRDRTGKSFVELDRAVKNQFLEQAQTDPFFAMLVDHTMQGFYGSPEHGGNRGEASWKMLGIEDVMRGHRH